MVLCTHIFIDRPILYSAKRFFLLLKLLIKTEVGESVLAANNAFLLLLTRELRRRNFFRRLIEVVFA